MKIEQSEIILFFFKSGNPMQKLLLVHGQKTFPPFGAPFFIIICIALKFHISASFWYHFAGIRYNPDVCSLQFASHLQKLLNISLTQPYYKFHKKESIFEMKTAENRKKASDFLPCGRGSGMPFLHFRSCQIFHTLLS